MQAGFGVAVGMVCMYREGDAWLGAAMWLVVFALWTDALRTRRPFMLALGVFLGSLPGTFVTHTYMIGVAMVGYLLFPLFVSAWFAAFAWIVARLANGRWPSLSVAVSPFVWVGCEYMRGELVLSGYPWYSLSHTVIGDGRFERFATLAGVYTVSLAMCGLVVLPICAARLLRRRTWGGLVFLLTLGPLTMIPIVFLPATGSPSSDQRTLRIACIQTNMSRDDKNARRIEGLYTHTQRWYELSRQAAAAGAELIVWPETMYSGYGLDDGTVAELRRSGLFFPSTLPGGPARIFLSSFYEDLMALQRSINVPMLVGAVAYDNFQARTPAGGGPVSITFDRRYNSLFLVENGLVDPRRYDKRRLVPFGEFLPLIRYIPGATKWVADIVGSKVPLDCTAGDHLRTFEVTGAQSRGPVRIITPICFEAVYGSTVRNMAWHDGQRQADLIVNISNDNWFGEGTRDRYAHMVNAAWRSIETGLPTVRCVNTGISCVIDSSGRVVHATVLPSGSVSMASNPKPGSATPPASDNVLTEGVMIYDVPIPDAAWKGTISMRIGDVVPITCTVITGACVLLAVFGRRAEPRSTPSTAPAAGAQNATATGRQETTR